MSGTLNTLSINSERIFLAQPVLGYQTEVVQNYVYGIPQNPSYECDLSKKCYSMVRDNMDTCICCSVASLISGVFLGCGIMGVQTGSYVEATIGFTGCASVSICSTALYFVSRDRPESNQIV